MACRWQMLSWWFKATLLSGLILFLLTILTINSADGKLVYRHVEANGNLRTMVYDKRRQQLYVGGMNSILFLSANDINVVTTVLTGPMDDNLDCPYDPRESCATRSATQNYNMLLVYDEEDDQLIVCGTLFYGSCERLDIQKQTFDLNLPHRPTVPNDPTKSVVALYVPSTRVTYDYGVLYVGASYSFLGNPSYQSLVNMLSVRQAASLNYLPGAASFKDVLSQYRASFPIEFVAAFEHEGFAYFVVTRKENFSTSQKRTFLLRFCLNDNKFESLVELRLECDVGGTVHGRLRGAHKAIVGQRLMADVLGDVTSSTWALYGLFTVDQNDEAKGDSAICVFPMKLIEEAAQKAIAKCFAGNAMMGPEYLVSQKSCSKRDVQIQSDYCGAYGVNHPFFENTPIRQTYYLALPTITGSSLRISTANDFTIANIGTTDGRFIQAVLRSRTSSMKQVYRETSLQSDSQGTITQLLLGARDTDGIYPYVFALTSNAVYRVQSFECETIASCTECIIDPHCGWCAASNLCTRKSVCPQATFWLNDRCPTLLSVDPTLVSRESFTSTSFTVKVNFLPADRKFVRCSLEESVTVGAPGSPENIPAKTDPSVAPGLDGQMTLTCGPFKNLPKDEVKVNMSLKITVDSAVWVTGAVTVYNCAKLNQCSQCSGTSFPCRWCMEQHSCLANSVQCNKPTGGTGMVIGSANDCPSISTKANKTVLVADGTTVTSFTLVAFNMMQYYRDSLQCRFKMAAEGKVLLSKAQYTGSGDVVKMVDVSCAPVTLKYGAAAPYDAVAVDLVWGNNQALDNPYNVTVQVYKCVHLVSTCGQCLALGEGYECGWCGRRTGGGECSPPGQCFAGGVWMGKQDVCTDPKITSIEPAGGPMSGGTSLTINGENLGKVPGDLQITVADRTCAVQDKGYIPSQRVICTTMNVERERRGPVVIKVSDRYTTPSANSPVFNYKDPSLGMGSMSPMMGPISGGTRVTILGKYLNYGSKFEILVNGLHSKIMERTADKVVFLTPRVTITGEAFVVLNIDSTAEFPLNDKFRYVPDPTVLRTEPMHSLFSGGSKLKVFGTGLNSVQKPMMILHTLKGNKTTPCTIVSSQQIDCITADLADGGYSTRDKIDVPVGWIMDNVTSLIKIQSGNWIRTLTYYPDPEIYVMPKPFQYTEKQQILEIKGTNIDVLKNFAEMEVLVGGATCWIDKKDTPEVIRCRMPEPDDPKELNNGLAKAVILLGNYKKEFGYVSYPYTNANVPLILGLVLGLLLPLLIIAAIIVFCLIKRKKKRRSTNRKPGPPSRENMDSMRTLQARTSNPYTEAERQDEQGTPLAPPRGVGGRPEETVPLNKGDDDYKDEDELLVKDDQKYFRELLKKINNPKVRSAARSVFISRERLELGNLLGKGHFGRVYAATLRDENLKNPVQVAVKTIEDSEPTNKLMENFLQEGIVMKNFNHPHVLGLIGMCLGYQKEPMVILPFMANGDLRTFVKDKRRSFTARQLLMLSQQVAQGMAYLSSLNYIHRDLAARNCMIDDRSVVKVADFGLSHQLYDKEYYSSKDPKSKLPIKWMALESLEEFVFTIKSDMWSFGVLMWELMTRGVTPYPDVEVFETRNYLASGRRLRKPKYCPDHVYQIMSDCWQANPEVRPTFSELVNRLEFLLNPPKAGQRGSGQDPTEPMYVNMAEPADNQDYLKPINPDSSYAQTDSSYHQET